MVGLKIIVFSSGFPRLLSDPETLRKQVTESLERERRAVGPVEEEAAHLRGELESLMEEREGYLRQRMPVVASQTKTSTVSWPIRTPAGPSWRKPWMGSRAGTRAPGRSSATSRSWTSTWRTSPTS